jgi:NAD(P)-dependent dehydrogenase (short-subunit alcohol dehydrogenase family)
MLSMEFSKRKILVTGASSGIGRAVAVELSRLGADVLLCARNQGRLEETLSLMAPGQHALCPFDLAEQCGEIPQWIKRLTKEHGPLNGLVHCAGIEVTLPVQQSDPDVLEKVLCINTKAALMLAKGVSHKTCCSLPCSIVFISSVMALVGRPARAIYSASKGALEGMTKSLAVELARKKIRVNTICPGQVQTEMDSAIRNKLGESMYKRIVEAHPLGLGDPEDVAASVAFLLSDMSRWITGTNIVVDGGYTAV